MGCVSSSDFCFCRINSKKKNILWFFINTHLFCGEFNATFFMQIPLFSVRLSPLPAIQTTKTVKVNRKNQVNSQVKNKFKRKSQKLGLN